MLLTCYYWLVVSFTCLFWWMFGSCVYFVGFDCFLLWVGYFACYYLLVVCCIVLCFCLDVVCCLITYLLLVTVLRIGCLFCG